MSTLSQFVGGSPIKSIQRGTITLGSTVASATATITSVDTAKSATTFLGFISSASGTSGIHTRLALTNSTTVTATRGNGETGTSNTISFEVIEYN